MQNKLSIKKFIRSFGHAANGLKEAAAGQNFKFHLAAALVAIALCFVLEVSDMELLIVLLCIGGVIGAEILNTSIEKLCDFVTPQTDKRIQVIKDLGAAAVLVVALTSFVAGLIIFLPKIMEKIL